MQNSKIMPSPSTLHIIGGMGSLASLSFETKVIERYLQLGRDHHVVHHCYTGFPERAAAAEDGCAALTDAIVEFVRAHCPEGGRVLVACFTANVRFKALARTLGPRFQAINPIAVLEDLLPDDRLLLLQSRSARVTGLFESLLSVRPRLVAAEDVDPALAERCYALIAAAKRLPRQRAAVRELCLAVEQLNCRGVILGCSDLHPYADVFGHWLTVYDPLELTLKHVIAPA
jgi:aspartate/glutamate racemase